MNTGNCTIKILAPVTATALNKRHISSSVIYPAGKELINVFCPLWRSGQRYFGLKLQCIRWFGEII